MATIPKISKAATDRRINEALALTMGWKRTDMHTSKGSMYMAADVPGVGPVLRPFDYRSTEICAALTARFGIVVSGSTASWAHRGITITFSDSRIERAIALCVIEGLRPRPRQSK